MIGKAATLVGALAAAIASPGNPQVRASERGGVYQLIDGTEIEVRYGRPRLRGRTAFGGVVHWGEMWTPGANRSSTLRVSKPVRIEGQAVPAGIYSIWLVPTETVWTLYLHRGANRYHLERPKPTEMLVSIPVKPMTLPAVDLLTFSFPETTRDGATLQLQWGTTAVAVRIEVEPTAPRRPRLTAAATAPYLGHYQVWFYAENGDSTEMRHRLYHEDGRLKGTIDDGRMKYELHPTGRPHQFWFELHDSAGPRDVELDGPVQFLLRSGRAAGFRMPGIEQAFWMRGVRIEP
jgi:hypothetical protein